MRRFEDRVSFYGEWATTVYAEDPVNQEAVYLTSSDEGLLIDMPGGPISDATAHQLRLALGRYEQWRAKAVPADGA